jgi:hypothetical protein
MDHSLLPKTNSPHEDKRYFKPRAVAGNGDHVFLGPNGAMHNNSASQCQTKEPVTTSCSSVTMENIPSTFSNALINFVSISLQGSPNPCRQVNVIRVDTHWSFYLFHQYKHVSKSSADRQHKFTRHATLTALTTLSSQHISINRNNAAIVTTNATNSLHTLARKRCMVWATSIINHLTLKRTITAPPCTYTFTHTTTLHMDTTHPTFGTALDWESLLGSRAKLHVFSAPFLAPCLATSFETPPAAWW